MDPTFKWIEREKGRKGGMSVRAPQERSAKGLGGASAMPRSSACGLVSLVSLFYVYVFISGMVHV